MDKSPYSITISVTPMEHDGRAVANFVLDRCEDLRRPITNLSLQKIVYFCHVWSLLEFGVPLVRHSFEAWQHGPVLQYLYRAFNSFEDQPISDRARRVNPGTGIREVVPYEFDERTTKLLIAVVDFYSRMSAIDLRRLSHVERGPWHQAWNHGGSVNPGMKIGDEVIRDFYSKARERNFSIQ